MLNHSLLVALLASVSAVQATLYITKPIASSTYSSQDVFHVNWEVDPTRTAPAASAFGAVTLGIYSGSTLDQFLVQDLGTVQDPTRDTELRVRVNGTIGPDSDAYFIRMQSIKNIDPATGAPYQSFSSRFTLRAMTGRFSSAQQKAIQSSNSTSVAPSLPAVVGNATGSARAPARSGASNNNATIAGIVSGTFGTDAGTTAANTTTTKAPEKQSSATSLQVGTISAVLAGAAGVLVTLW